jgi:excisionase family DNA binding protein
MQVTIAEAARILRLSEMTVRRRVRNGELEGIHVATPGGFTWMVELPEESSNDGPSTGETKVLRELVDTLRNQVDNQNRQIEQLHVLLQQAQAALPAPREGKSWWRLWSRAN